MNHLEKLHYFLGVRFERNKEACTIAMNQNNHIDEVLKHFNMEECQPVRSPFDANSKLLKLSDEEFENVVRPNPPTLSVLVRVMVLRITCTPRKLVVKQNVIAISLGTPLLRIISFY